MCCTGKSALLLPAGAAAIMMAAVSAAPAGVTFRYATDSSEYVVAPGGSAVVALKLVEQRDSEADASVLIAQGGVIGYDVSVGRDAGTALITALSANAGLFDIPFASAWLPDPLPIGGSASIDWVASSLDDPGPTGTPTGSLIRELILGTIAVTPMHASEPSVFTVADSTYFGSNTVTNAAIALDGQIQATQFTVHVPEPTIAAVLFSGAALISRRRSDRRRTTRSQL